MTLLKTSFRRMLDTFRSTFADSWFPFGCNPKGALAAPNARFARGGDVDLMNKKKLTLLFGAACFLAACGGSGGATSRPHRLR